ncbi:MAG TPA: hypothetical protein VKQ34_03880, partial [Candidatus Saccharimonadales bacterium]|nr:hypothetical protein [Candidatus Saccharimonadales bacterium]
TPVAALRRGAYTETIIDGKTGILCDSVDEIIKRWPELEHIDPATCRAHVEAHFTDEHMARGMEQVIGQVLAGAR